MHRGISLHKGKFYPKGVVKTDRGYQFVFRAEEGTSVTICLYAGKKIIDRIKIPDTYSRGDLYSVILENIPGEADGYGYRQGEESLIDFYAPRVYGMEKYGKKKGQIHYGLPEDSFDWEEDRPLQIPYSKSIVYGLHVRGFTKSPTSEVTHKGTFAGLAEKIPYLKDLGVTAIELMPSYEFEETGAGNPMYQRSETEQRQEKVNYWGYLPGYYYAPKSGYAATPDPVREMKEMIKSFHKAGIEVLLKFYFPKEVQSGEIPGILYHWVCEYHIDGFHLLGESVPYLILAVDPLLSGTKMIGSGFADMGLEQGKKPGSRGKQLGFVRESFTRDMRRFLKGDEDFIRSFQYYMTEFEETRGILHAICTNNGFTLHDLVSYERKHNEANGENNHDGDDYNYSWNCGAEGKTRKRSIVNLRKKQMKNAILFVLLSQATPFLLGGDEFCRTQEGNNNPYCQDNPITWVDWKLLDKNREFYQFVKKMIAFRREHIVFRREVRLRGMDYIGCGCPDVSYHGEEAWRPVLENYSRQLGIMYCGKYALEQGRKEDSTFYLATNMHWEEHSFALPRISKSEHWELLLSTEETAPGPIVSDQEKATLQVPPRSICLCVAKQADLNFEKKQGKPASPQENKKKEIKKKEIVKDL